VGGIDMKKNFSLLDFFLQSINFDTGRYVDLERSGIAIDKAPKQTNGLS
jgi:hypothetical protein